MGAGGSQSESQGSGKNRELHDECDDRHSKKANILRDSMAYLWSNIGSLIAKYIGQCLLWRRNLADHGKTANNICLVSYHLEIDLDP